MDKQLILGSNSPRRREIMQLAGYQFEIVVSHEEERVNPSTDVYMVPEELARQKADHILPGIAPENFLLITSDTVVLLNGELIGKPVDLDDARNILRKLSGSMHEVVSGVCLCDHHESHCFSDITRVHFNHLMEDEIEFYIQNYEVLDKAGAYAIQEGLGMTAVESIEGSYYNVMGLPIHKVHRFLKERGIHPVKT